MHDHGGARGRWRVSVVGLIVVLAALTAPAPVQATPAPRPAAPRPVALRVLSFNIHHAEGPDGRVDLDRVAAEIRASGADVVGLQEVDRHYGARSGWLDQGAELAARLGMEVAYGAHVDLDPPAPGAPRRQYGTAILSRFPVLSSVDTPLPSGGAAEEPRGLLEAVVAAPGGAVRVATAHLAVEGPGSRLAQAGAVIARLALSPEPVLLVGDLNAAPDAPEVAVLTAWLADLGACGDTFPADAPAERIDHILGEGRATDCAVLPTASSDHRPIVVTVEPA